MEKKQWHAKSVEETLRDLNANENGLKTDEVEERRKTFGYNELIEKKRKTALQMFLGEFKDIFILLLLAATVLSAIIGNYESVPGQGILETYTDSITIFIIVVLVAVAGFIQEYRAEKAVEALRKLTAPKARVMRDGKETMIPAREVVPGDMLVLESGDTVPADARVFQAIELKSDEAVLTGESTPVNKVLDVVKLEAAVGERKNMLFMATHTIYGRGKAIVTSIGMGTEFGRIAELVQATEEEETPLQRKLDIFAKKIAYAVIILAAIIFVLEFFAEGFNIKALIDSFMIAIALAISVVPEGLPAIVTITLALGAREFAKRHAIIRRLSSAESLGATTVICSDKTGTLTRGEMTVRRIYDGKIVDVTGVGYEPRGEFNVGNNSINPLNDIDLSMTLTIGSLCNNAKLDKDNGAWHIIGDPTEGALIVAATKAGLEIGELDKQYPRISEIPFTSEKKRMTTIHSTEKKSPS
jgi:Ca2+-transporting ATPase